MKELFDKDAALAQTKQIIRQVINAWASQSKGVTTFFNKYADEAYLEEVSPGRNRAVYIFGHLIAASDSLLPMFGLGEKLFPQLEALFTTSPDRAFADIPSVDELKQYWETVNATLAERFATMLPSDWLERHTRVSEEDFVVDPLRNKLNVLIARTNHIGYHSGQLTFLTKKEPVS